MNFNVIAKSTTVVVQSLSHEILKEARVCNFDIEEAIEEAENHITENGLPYLDF
jgi:hypothetical protein